MRYSTSFLIGLYKMMLRIRTCEESLVGPIIDKEVRCPCHLYSGEEAVATGICASLNKKDHIFGTHRSHGHFLAKGGSMKALLAEIFCREDGCSGGRGGSMHLIDPNVGMLGAAPIVAGTISLALGAALSFSIRRNRQVAVCFFGDGATGEGVLYESMNFAALKRLPILFVCENNFYSTHLPISECRVNRNIADIAKPFDISSTRVNGNDVLAVYEAGAQAIQQCRTGKGPAFMECLTYRQRGHVGPDDNVQGSHVDIRPKEEIAAWNQRDPICAFGKVLLRKKVLTETEFQELGKAVTAEVQAALRFARQSPFPRKEHLLHHVYA